MFVVHCRSYNSHAERQALCDEARRELEANGSTHRHRQPKPADFSTSYYSFRFKTNTAAVACMTELRRAAAERGADIVVSISEARPGLPKQPQLALADDWPLQVPPPGRKIDRSRWR
jgi:hypothetical protein